MGAKRQLWIGFNHLKLLTAVAIFTPLVKYLPLSLEGRIDLQFYWMIVAVVISPFMRFYREHWTAVEKEKQQKTGKSE